MDILLLNIAFINANMPNYQNELDLLHKNCLRMICKAIIAVTITIGGVTQIDQDHDSYRNLHLVHCPPDMIASLDHIKFTLMCFVET